MKTSIHNIKPHQLVKVQPNGKGYRISFRDAEKFIVLNFDEESYDYFYTQIKRMNYRLASKRSYNRRKTNDNK
jgi:hypothetical protein|tara:strand:- start:10244 stop:10462 length:219 start_codon:yes stop_codon:yes gene_type:complete